jgi:hypothetical protein
MRLFLALLTLSALLVYAVGSFVDSAFEQVTRNGRQNWPISRSVR